MRPPTTVPRRRRRLPLLPLLPLLALGLALAPGTMARDAPVGTYPVASTIQDPCTGEEVAVAGVVRFVGGDHFRTRVGGVGAGGTTYEVRVIDNEGTAPSRGAHTYTLTTAIRFVRDGAGGGDDFTAQSIVHATMNANGEWTVRFYLGRGGADCS